MTPNLAFDAMRFARHVHRDQRRKYTGAPYADHLAEVAGIALSVCPPWMAPVVGAAAWLHDSMEDQGVTLQQIVDEFGQVVASAVFYLSDLERVGNRAERKAIARRRLAGAWPWVQTVKVADLISNTSSIVEHDPAFARVYLPEKVQLLDALVHADPGLVAIARGQVREALAELLPLER